jgi:predicted N-acetyltransferase YhbS
VVNELREMTGKMKNLCERVAIRQEKPSDYDEVYELVRVSFATNSDDDGTTSDYLNQLRKKDTFIPELSLVAQNDDGKIIGQIVLYKTDITTINGKITELLLSPICVHPDYFRRGIARSMIEEAFRIATGLGYRAVFLCGEPEIYRKFGFVPSFEYGIFHISEELKNAEWSMVFELSESALADISGTVDIV